MGDATSLLRVDEVLAGASWPALMPVDLPEVKPEDIYVCCAGFEDRCMAILKGLRKAGREPSKVVIITYLPFLRDNRLDEIREVLKTLGVEGIVLEYDRPNPEIFYEELSKLDVLHSNGARWWVDISGMSRFLIVQLLVHFQKTWKGWKNLFMLYAEARRYPPGKQEVRHRLAKKKKDPFEDISLLSKGVFDIAVVPELSSDAMQSEPIRLVAFPSFNTQQLSVLRSELQPSVVDLIHGVPPMKENRWRREAIRSLNQIGRMSRTVEHDMSTLDYRETLSLLLRLYGESRYLYRFVLSPTGSKMQAVAVGILGSFLRDVQVVYPIPKEFVAPREYTQGARQFYCLDLSRVVIPEAAAPDHL